jgi:hypothetical protein
MGNVSCLLRVHEVPIVNGSEAAQRACAPAVGLDTVESPAELPSSVVYTGCPLSLVCPFSSVPLQSPFESAGVVPIPEFGFVQSGRSACASQLAAENRRGETIMEWNTRQGRAAFEY